MQPQIIQLPEIHLLGLGAKFISVLSPNANNKSVIGELWGQYGKRMNEIPSRTDFKTAWGVVEMLPKSQQPANPQPGEMHLYYLAAAQVAPNSPVPAGFESRTLPAGKYALFTHKGPLTTLGQTMQFIFGQWLPNAIKQGTKRRPAPDLERYDQRFAMNSANSEMDILIPIE